MALSNYNRFLYVLNSALGTVSAFSVVQNGNRLSSLPGVSGLPITAQGLVAE